MAALSAAATVVAEASTAAVVVAVVWWLLLMLLLLLWLSAEPSRLRCVCSWEPPGVVRGEPDGAPGTPIDWCCGWWCVVLVELSLPLRDTSSAALLSTAAAAGTNASRSMPERCRVS